MREVRIGIIGAGIIAQEHLRRYQDIPGVTVVAVCDFLAEKREAAQAKYGVAVATQDYRELLARDDIEAVDVCLHNNLHAPMTVAAMRAGKHVYCEKPMAGSYADAAAMLRASEQLGRKLHIQLGMLYSREARAAKRLIDDGHLGRLYHARSVGFRRRGRPFVDGYATKEFDQMAMAAGGALYDMGVYHISQCLYLMGLPVIERVSGRVYQELDMHPGRKAESGFDVEEFATGLVAFDGGATMDVLESWAVHDAPFGGSSIMGNKGGLHLDPFSYHSFLSDLTMSATFDLTQDDWRDHQIDPGVSAYSDSQRHWIAVLRDEVQNIGTPEIALQTMLVSEGIYLSNKLGREVLREEIVDQSRSSALKTQDSPWGETLRYAAHPFL